MGETFRPMPTLQINVGDTKVLSEYTCEFYPLDKLNILAPQNNSKEKFDVAITDTDRLSMVSVNLLFHIQCICFPCFFFIIPFKSLTIRRNKKGFVQQMCPAMVSGIVIGDARVSHWPIIFPVPSYRPISLCES